MKSRDSLRPSVSFLAALVLGFLFAGSLPESSAVNYVPENFSELAEKVSPAVVNIRTEKTIQGGGRVFRQFRSPFDKDDPMRDFFERFFGQDQQKDSKQRSLGSGILIDQEGYIVTNNHVVESADQIQVLLRDTKEYDAEVVGRDVNTDLALIRIKGDGAFPVAELGDSDSLKVGEWVVAIGNPFGLQHTVTAGIVSAKGRVIGSGPYDDFIQTDASINPGNSGGPLLNMTGQVVGINTAIVASGQGIGFAIPINMAKGILEQLRAEGTVTRGWLGVAIQDFSKELAEYYGIQGGKGVLVTEVFVGDPAEKAGIKAKDIIVSVNEKPVNTSHDLTGLVAGLKVGELAKVDVLRDGERMTFNVRIAKRDDDRILSQRMPQESEAPLGITVDNLTPEIADRFNIKEAAGVIVTDVKAGGKGAEAGVLAGDIIKEVNHDEVGTAEDYIRSVEKVKPGEPVQLFIKRVNAGFLVIKMTR
ncbi:MAG: Do family serine endopeptidase [Desulfobacteraceae bacterium]|nr:MAG: Do family serine endopeptidase [Desulfobacteraceae bacterium]